MSQKKYKIMITEQDKRTVNNMRKYLDKLATEDKTGVNCEMEQWIETLDRLVSNLCIAPVSYRFCSPGDIADRFYTAECPACGWYGSSKYLNGGGPIGDTGDHFDCDCPVCGNFQVDEKDEE